MLSKVGYHAVKFSRKLTKPAETCCYPTMKTFVSYKKNVKEEDRSVFFIEDFCRKCSKRSKPPTVTGDQR